MSDSDANHFGVLLEQIVDQNKAVLEAVGDIQQKVAIDLYTPVRSSKIRPFLALFSFKINNSNCS